MLGMCEDKKVNGPAGIRDNLKMACDGLRTIKYKLLVMRNELSGESMPDCDCEEDASLSMLELSELVNMMACQINEIVNDNLRCLVGND